MHVHRGKDIEALVPASGLVTALEPILRACDGTWIAHGSGEADREVVDRNDRLRVPPDNPEYTLRRVWLTKQEEQGYYYGFANEGLWPLCHIAHARPLFRTIGLGKLSGSESQIRRRACWKRWPARSTRLLLVQDYHFALLPRMVKEARPDVRVAIFWHIPWPNPEAFGICPWQRELARRPARRRSRRLPHAVALQQFPRDGRCGVLESRIEWERFSVQAAGPSHVRAAVSDQRGLPRDAGRPGRTRPCLPTSCAHRC